MGVDPHRRAEAHALPVVPLDGRQDEVFATDNRKTDLCGGQAIEAYRNETVTLSRAAEIAGLSSWDLLARLEAAQVDLHYGAADLIDDLATLERQR